MNSVELIVFVGCCVALCWWGHTHWRSYRVRKYGIKLKNGRKPWE